MGAALDIGDESLIGQVLDERYEMMDLLGEGGMGLVYRARHVFSGGEVAVKVLRAAALAIPGVLERVEREAIAASSIGDAHIVDVRDFGQLPSGEPYMVMELLDGTELAELIEDEPELPIERVCHIVDQVARALAAAHEIGIVHRDLKSENVLLVERPGTADFVKLVDFGIAHVQNENSKITRAGELLGTPQYMSPEQCAGRPVDHRTDIYALGVLLYELLTGELPFESEDLRALLFAHMATEPTPPSAHRPGIPEALEAIVLRCLEKSPDDRFGSMTEVSEALAAVPGYSPRARYTPRKVADSLASMAARVPADELSLADTILPNNIPPMATSLPPVAPSISPAPPMRARRWPLVLGVIAAVLGLGAGAGLVASNMTSSPAATTETREAAAPPPTETREAATPPPPETREAATQTPEVAAASAGTEEIEITSVEGASVEFEGTLVGTVPVTFPRPEGSERLIVTVSREGYQTRRVALSQLTSASMHVPLDPVEVAPRRRPRASDPEPQPAVEPAPEVVAPEPPAPAAAPAEPQRPTRQRPFLNPWD